VSRSKDRDYQRTKFAETAFACGQPGWYRTNSRSLRDRKFHPGNHTWIHPSRTPVRVAATQLSRGASLPRQHHGGYPSTPTHRVRSPKPEPRSLGWVTVRTVPQCWHWPPQDLRVQCPGSPGRDGIPLLNEGILSYYRQVLNLLCGLPPLRGYATGPPGLVRTTP